MADLREEVATRLRNALHGREIDMMENRVELPHMLGITPIGKIHDPNNEDMTILDTKHPFWEDYHEDVRTPNAVSEKIQTAIRSLRRDDIFRMTYPYGEEAEVVYVEVDKMERESEQMTTECAECGETIDANLELRNAGKSYILIANLDCPHCEFGGVYEEPMTRR